MLVLAAGLGAAHTAGLALVKQRGAVARADPAIRAAIPAPAVPGLESLARPADGNVTRPAGFAPDSTGIICSPPTGAGQGAEDEGRLVLMTCTLMR